MSYVVSREPTTGRTLLAALLAALSARPAAALLTTPTVHLYTAATTPPNPNSSSADFTEATFNGYAPVALGAFAGPINLPSAAGIGLTIEADFIAGGAIVAPGETIVGYWIDDGTAGPNDVFLSEQFLDAIPVVNPGDFVSLDVVWGQSFLTPVS